MDWEEELDNCKKHVHQLISEGHSGLRQPSYPTQSLAFLHRLQNTQSKNPSLPLQAKHSLKIIISGAGLGGLSTAIALRRRGHTVTVYERAQRLDEVGAGIQVPPNSSRLLLKWGIGKYLHGKANEPEAIRMRRWENGKVIGLTRLGPAFREEFGAPYWVVHRANLQIALYELAVDLGVEVHVGNGVKGYEEGTPSVILEDGSVDQGDLVVAADGIKSAARKIVLRGEDQPPQKAGFAAYRAMVDTGRMKDDPDISWLLDHPGQNLWIGPARHVMTYSVAGGKSFNMVLSHPESSDPATWNQTTALLEMKSHFRTWDPALRKLINMIDTTLKWPLLTGKPLPHWLSPSNKLLIIGDAAHPMVPYMSSGAAMAVEDGAALAEILSLISNPTDLVPALKVFEKIRILRTGQMQEASLVNGKIWHFEDGAEQRARDAAMRVEVEGGLVRESANQWSDPVTRGWVFGYDAEREIREAWGESKEGGRGARL
ncbi:hypothetical protein B0J11DRAFT_590980 [Dendryphion nanum]|uniref:FAD-binding domain-containing protein n=1 Tax=Dendryphion nanum TaxID=256645 RepID=A0A9P9DJY4_9PLEO|nr:hypothetical protein B0J11DRAFT_590980 [Dendryphion nanum]